MTAAYQLTKRGVPSTVLESDSVVGGISRTAERDGYTLSRDELVPLFLQVQQEIKGGSYELYAEVLGG